jgi:hypothetical protein
MGKGEGAEVLPRAVQDRFDAELRATLRRRSAGELKLAGAVRTLLPLSPALRDMCVDAARLLVKRGSFQRDLYRAIVRGLAESGDPRTAPLIEAALSSDDAGGLCTLSAASFCSDPSLGIPLAKVAAGRQSDLAFAAEVARVVRGNSNGAHLAALAPKIKESHRIALFGHVLLPLTRGGELPRALGPPLAVLRDAERHLGRWLVAAEVGTRAGDTTALAFARQAAATGAESSRAAWTLLAWALQPTSPPPASRPTVELISRLSDRPSADRDTAFLFRLAAAAAPGTRPMLEALAKPLPLASELAVRAAMHLARDHGQQTMRAAVLELAASRADELRGVAAAALWELGEDQAARTAAEEAHRSRSIGSVTWGVLVQAAADRAARTRVLMDPTFRRVQWGWLE